MSKIAILTSFSDLNPGYSLTGIVEDQVAMLTRYGHEVHLFVQADFNRSAASDRIRQAELQAVVPFARLVDYRDSHDLTEEHRLIVADTRDALVASLTDFDLVYTHDWCFTGWNLPYFLGLLEAVAEMPGLKCWHWIHSIPSPKPDGGIRDWWNLKHWPPATSHKLVYPNRSDALRVAEMYRCDLSDILIIPHLKDPRSWYDFDAETCRFIDCYPAVMQAEIVQLLPVSCDRLQAKRIDDVIRIFGTFKRLGRSVCLIIANQWATGRKAREDIDPYKRLAEEAGLVVGEELIFTSDFPSWPGRESYTRGLPRVMIRELFQLSNLFIFPTDHESFGLVVPEAALAGVYLVGNESLTQQLEITGHQAGLYFRFGSFTNPVRYSHRNKWLSAVASRIITEMDRDPAVRMKTWCRRQYNRDAMYRLYYQPYFSLELEDNVQMLSSPYLLSA